MTNARDLSLSILQFLTARLTADAGRWGPLLEFPNLLEGWWKGEVARALIDWTWHDAGAADAWYCVGLEQGPAGGIWRTGKDGRKCDIVVYRYDRESGDYAPVAGPRVWLELKNRVTTWDPAKALGLANKGPLYDLQKWSDVTWTDDEAAVALLFLAHKGEGKELPAAWEEPIQRAGQPLHRSVHHFTQVEHGKNVTRWMHLIAWDVRAGSATAPNLRP